MAIASSLLQTIKNVAKKAQLYSILHNSLYQTFLLMLYDVYSLMPVLQGSIPKNFIKKNQNWQSYSTFVESDYSYKV